MSELLTWWNLPGRRQQRVSPRSFGGARGTVIAGLQNFVADSFTDVNDTLLTAHTGEVGATWTKHPAYAAGGNVTIRNNETQMVTLPTTAYYASGVPPTANYTVGGRFRWHGGAPLGTWIPWLFGRLDTVANTGYLFRYGSTGGGSYEIFAMNAGALGAAIASVVVGAQTQDFDYNMELRMNGTTIQGWVNGVQQLSVVDATIAAAGRAGMRRSNTMADTDAVNATIDNFFAIQIP